MQVRRAAAAASAATEAGHQVDALVAVAAASAGGAVVGGGGTGGGAAREPAGLPCPRCESTDTKFCYYNNYNLGQPRHFCRGCRRYWTRGGVLRNVPVGGGTRKPSLSARRKQQKRAAAASSSSASSASTAASPTSSALMAPSATPLAMSAPAYATGVRPYGDLPFTPVGDHVDRRMLLGLGHDRRTLLGLDRRMLIDPDRRLLELGGSFTSLLAPAPDGGRFSSPAGFLGGGPPVAGDAADATCLVCSCSAAAAAGVPPRVADGGHDLGRHEHDHGVAGPVHLGRPPCLSVTPAFVLQQASMHAHPANKVTAPSTLI